MRNRLYLTIMVFPSILLLMTCGFWTEENLLSGFADVGGPTVTAVPADGSRIDGSPNTIDLTFSEEVTGADIAGNYSFSGAGAGSLSVSGVVPVSGTTYRLTFSGTPGSGGITLTLSNILDLTGKPMEDDTVSYTGWWDTDWSARRRLTFDNTAQSSDLDGFSVMVRLNTGRVDYSRTQDVAQDIRFVDADGTVLNHEIEVWNESGESTVWVRVPRVDGSSSSDHIYMYYGNAGASDSQNPTGVWDSDYLAVWHLNESPAGTHYDSTGNDIDGTASGNTPYSSGPVRAQEFDGNNDCITMGDVNALDTPGYLTLSIGFYRHSDVNSATNHGIENVLLAQSSTSSNDNLEIGTDGNNIEMYVDTSGTDGPFTYNAGITNNTWYLVTFTYDQDDANEIKLYVAGSMVYETNSGSGTLSDSAASPLTLGLARPGGSDWGDYEGIIDEVRISTSVRSDDWIAAQYLSQSDSFITFGAEE